MWGETLFHKETVMVCVIEATCVCWPRATSAGIERKTMWPKYVCPKLH